MPCTTRAGGQHSSPSSPGGNENGLVVPDTPTQGQDNNHESPQNITNGSPEDGITPGGRRKRSSSNSNTFLSNSEGTDGVDADEDTWPGIGKYKAALWQNVKEAKAEDTKANAASRGKRLLILRQDWYQKMIVIWKYRQQAKAYKEADKKIAELEAKIEELQKSNAKGATAKKQHQKAMVLKICEDHKKKAQAIAKSALWRNTKFAMADDEVYKCCRLVYDYMGLDWDEDKVESFCVTYEKHIMKALAYMRNYLTQELKKVAEKMYKEKIPLPNEAEILSCATRTCTNEDTIIWYWEEIMPKTVGAKLWDAKKRHYQLLSNLKDEHGKKLATIATEAFAVLIWVNNVQKWPKLFEWLKKPENKGKDQACPAEIKNGLWTITDGGQHSHAAWKPEGLQKFVDYKKIIREARKDKETYLNRERAYLKIVRKKFGKVCLTHEDEVRAKQVNDS